MSLEKYNNDKLFHYQYEKNPSAYGLSKAIYESLTSLHLLHEFGVSLKSLHVNKISISSLRSSVDSRRITTVLPTL